MKARDLKCFEQVSKVIGEGEAEKELQRVIDHGWKIIKDVNLDGSFTWHNTPQGSDFWKQIWEGKVKQPEIFFMNIQDYTPKEINGFFEWCKENLGTEIVEKALEDTNTDNSGQTYDIEAFIYFGVDGDNETLIADRPSEFPLEAGQHAIYFMSIEDAKEYLIK